MEDGLDGLDPAYAQITDVITLVNWALSTVS
jgi:hypothetical protein